MKKLLILLFLLLISTKCFASVVGTVIDIVQDENNGSIVVRTNYVVDGVELKSSYPQLNGKYYWVTRYNMNQFAGMTDQEVKDYIFKDVQEFGESIIRSEYFKKSNANYIVDMNTNILNSKLDISTADINVDEDHDGKADKKWVVKMDGTREEEAITADPVN